MAYRREKESNFTGIPFVEGIHKCLTDKGTIVLRVSPAEKAIYVNGTQIGMHIAIDDYHADFIPITHCPWCGEKLTVKK